LQKDSQDKGDRFQALSLVMEAVCLTCDCLWPFNIDEPEGPYGILTKGLCFVSYSSDLKELVHVL